MKETTKLKRRDAVKTRARILSVAFDAFSVQGYAKTGIREIATKAGISSSLIARYFGAKSNLFEEALTHGIYTHSLFVHDKKCFGETMAKMLVSKSSPELPVMMMLGLADPESKDIAKRVSQRHVIEPLAEWIGPPNAKARALSMLVLLNGFTLQTQLSSGKIPPHSVKWLAQSLQAILDDQ